MFLNNICIKSFIFFNFPFNLYKKIFLKKKFNKDLVYFLFLKDEKIKFLSLI